MKFIHCADLHLDSKIESNLPTAKSRERRKEILLSFGKTVEFAKKNDVKVIVIAGDLFDTEKICASTIDYIFKTVSAAPEIDFLYLQGNHDRNVKIQDSPENFKIFGDAWTSFNYGNVCFCGVCFTNVNNRIIYESLKLDENNYNVVVMHGSVSASFGIDEIKISELKDKNIDYLALGHIHKNSITPLDNRGTCVYSGCLEGRGFDECGKKGFYLVDTDVKSCEFVSECSRTLFEQEVDISGLVSSYEILDKINSLIDDTADEKDMIKVVLTGSFTVETQKDITFFEKSLNDKYFFAKVKDKSAMQIDVESYKNDVSLKGEFIRTVLAELDGKENIPEVISYGIKALNGEEIE